MTGKSKRGKRVPPAGNKPTEPSGSLGAADDGPIVTAVIPAALMLRFPLPVGTPRLAAQVSAQLWVTRKSAAFEHLSSEERAATFESATRTLRKSVYHRERLHSLLAAMDDRRQRVPGDVIWDEIVEATHFELQGFCGAARTLLDELVYLTARRHSIPEKKARRLPWETAPLIKDEVPPKFDVPMIKLLPEIKLLRQSRPWFDALNAYRNSAYHHGWHYGGGHFAATEQRAGGRNPAMNALLLPDWTSMGARSKPHEWTWNAGETIPAVTERIEVGLTALLRELCANAWGTEEPQPGKLPPEEHPHMIVALARPALMITPHMAIVPAFTTEALAREFSHFASDPKVELQYLRKVSLGGKRQVAFSMRGLEQTELPSGAAYLDLMLDPSSQNDEWSKIVAKDHQRIPLGPLLGASSAEKLVVNQTVLAPLVGLEGLYVWCMRFEKALWSSSSS